MNSGQYIFINKGLGMTPGKIAAQAAHASVEGYRLSCGLVPHQPQEELEAREEAATRHWYKGGHYAKYVMEARDSEQLRAIQEYLKARGFKTVLIVDEGHTEGTEFVPTALATEPVDRNHPHVKATFGEFTLYKESPRYTVLECTGRVPKPIYDQVKRLLEEGKPTQAKLILDRHMQKGEGRVKRLFNRVTGASHGTTESTGLHRGEARGAGTPRADG